MLLAIPHSGVRVETVLLFPRSAHGWRPFWPQATPAEFQWHLHSVSRAHWNRIGAQSHSSPIPCRSRAAGGPCVVRFCRNKRSSRISLNGGRVPSAELRGCGGQILGVHDRYLGLAGLLAEIEFRGVHAWSFHPLVPHPHVDRCDREVKDAATDMKSAGKIQLVITNIYYLRSSLSPMTAFGGLWRAFPLLAYQALVTPTILEPHLIPCSNRRSTTLLGGTDSKACRHSRSPVLHRLLLRTLICVTSPAPTCSYSAYCCPAKA